MKKTHMLLPLIAALSLASCGSQPTSATDTATNQETTAAYLGFDKSGNVVAADAPKAQSKMEAQHYGREVYVKLANYGEEFTVPGNPAEWPDGMRPIVFANPANVVTNSAGTTTIYGDWDKMPWYVGQKKTCAANMWGSTGGYTNYQQYACYAIDYVPPTISTEYMEFSNSWSPEHQSYVNATWNKLGAVSVGFFNYNRQRLIFRVTYNPTDAEYAQALNYYNTRGWGGPQSAYRYLNQPQYRKMLFAIYYTQQDVMKMNLPGYSYGVYYMWFDSEEVNKINPRW